MPPEERRRYHQEAVAAISQGAEPKGDLITRFDAYPGLEKLSVNVARFAVRDGDYLYCRLPLDLTRLLQLRSDTRESPWYSDRHARLRVTARVRMPAGFTTLRLQPPRIQWTDPAGRGHVGVEVKRTSEDTLTIRQDVRLAPGIVPAGDYPRLLDIHRELSHPGMGLVLLQAK